MIHTYLYLTKMKKIEIYFCLKNTLYIVFVPDLNRNVFSQFTIQEILDKYHLCAIVIISNDKFPKIQIGVYVNYRKLGKGSANTSSTYKVVFTNFRL
jgi:hypothetical protein